jgi:hypothetical protein
MSGSRCVFIRRREAISLIGGDAGVWRKWVEAGLITKIYLKDPRSGLPQGRAFYRRAEVERLLEEQFVEAAGSRPESIKSQGSSNKMTAAPGGAEIRG